MWLLERHALTVSEVGIHQSMVHTDPIDEAACSRCVCCNADRGGTDECFLSRLVELNAQPSAHSRLRSADFPVHMASAGRSFRPLATVIRIVCQSSGALPRFCSPALCCAAVLSCRRYRIVYACHHPPLLHCDRVVDVTCTRRGGESTHNAPLSVVDPVT